MPAKAGVCVVSGLLQIRLPDMRNDRIPIGIQKVPPVREPCVGVAQAVVAGEVCGDSGAGYPSLSCRGGQGCAGRSGTKKAVKHR